MNPINVNDVILTEEMLNILKDWQSDNEIGTIPEVLRNAVCWISCAAATGCTDNAESMEALRLIGDLCLIVKRIEKFKKPSNDVL